MSAAALAIAVVCTLIGGWHLACASGMRRSVDLVLVWLVLSTAQLSALTLLVGGLLRRLEADALFGAALVVAAAEVVLTRRPGPDAARRRGHALVAGLWPRVRGAWRHPVVVVMALLVGAQYCWRGALAAFLGPLDYDGLWYHLPGPMIWLQQGYVGHTPAVLWADVYPQGQELLTGFGGAFLGDTRLGWASGLPFLALGAVATAGLARTAGARRAHAVLAGLGILAIPAVFLEASTTYVDFAAAATTLAALHLTLGIHPAVVTTIDRGEDTTRVLRGRVLLVGIALGLAIGVKSSNLLTAAVVGVLVLAQTWRTVGAARRASTPGTPPAPPARAARLRAHAVATIRIAAPNSVVLGVPMLALGGYWYIRTWLRYGNPFHPFTMLGFHGKGTVDEVIIRNTIAPQVAGESRLRATWDSWLFDRERVAYTYDQQPGGFGLQWIYVLLPVVLVGIALFVLGRRFELLWGLLLPVVVSALASPAPWWARYQLLVPAFGCVCLAAVLTAVGQRSRGPGSRLGRVPAVPPPLRRCVAGALAGAFVAATATSMWWATQPTNTWVGDRTSGHRATVGETLDLIRDPDRDRRILPTAAYAAMNRVPDGRTVAFTEFALPHFVQPIMGERGQRRVASLGEPGDVADFARRLRDSGARYVLLSVGGRDRDLLLAVLRDRAHYRPVVRGSGGIGWFGGSGAELFEVGDFTDTVCTNRQPRLVARRGEHDTIVVSLRDACGGPLFEVEVQLLGSAGATPVRVWTTREGETLLRIPPDLTGRPLLVRFPGDGYYDPAEVTVN
ncbi:phospholipid carrier-dependent glycosyltransferase [Embleya sp. AB8]|uniref:phospholipid carrier-dependent glycosyltransferase n=1 Tax=Embleya sp. AB8 TaxID=3156304 RepID=UPI003C76E347